MSCTELFKKFLVLSGTNFTQPAPPRIYLLPCLNYTSKTWVNLTQKEILDQLVHNTQIQRNATTLSVYKLKCRVDTRTSSKVVGLLGSVFLIIVLALIVLLDLSTLRAHITIYKL